MCVGLEQHGAIGAHGEGLANLFLRGVGAERDHDDLTGAGLFLELQRGFDRPEIEIVDVVLEARLFDAGALGGDGELHFHHRDALDAHGDLHRECSI